MSVRAMSVNESKGTVTEDMPGCPPRLAACMKPEAGRGERKTRTGDCPQQTKGPVSIITREDLKLIIGSSSEHEALKNGMSTDFFNNSYIFKI